MQKKHLILLIVFNFFLVLLGCSIVWSINNHTITSAGLSLKSDIGTSIKDIKQANFLALESHLVDMFDTTKDSVVYITISKDVKVYIDDPSQLYGPGNIKQHTTTLGGGSGIIVSKKGYIITNKHVVQDTSAKYSVILADGTTHQVDKIRFDEVLDIAILKLADTTDGLSNDLVAASFLPLAKPADIGQFVFVAANPTTVTMGILGGKNKQFSINGKNLYIGLYQTDAQSNPGNSGGPLLDLQGNVLGITTAIVEGEGITFALPISKEFVDATLRSIEQFGKIARPVVGIQYVESSTISQSLKKGIHITDVLTNLPAWEAGIKIGDIVVGINGHVVDTELPFLYHLYTHTPGETITFDIVRNDTSLHIPVILGGIPQ